MIDILIKPTKESTSLEFHLTSVWLEELSIRLLELNDNEEKLSLNEIAIRLDENVIKDLEALTERLKREYNHMKEQGSAK